VPEQSARLEGEHALRFASCLRAARNVIRGSFLLWLLSHFARS
jgi:hypothetical protein